MPGIQTNCLHCVYWEARTDYSDRAVGECHRHAPQPLTLSIPVDAAEEDFGDMMIFWAITDYTDWCGDFKQKP